MQQILSPGMQDGEETDFGAAVSGIARDGDYRFGMFLAPTLSGGAPLLAGPAAGHVMKPHFCHGHRLASAATDNSVVRAFSGHLD